MSTGSASRVSCTGSPPTAAMPFGYSLRCRSTSSPCNAPCGQVRHPLDRPSPPGQPDQRPPAHAVVPPLIGRRLMPLMKFERSRSTGPSSRTSASLRQQLLEQHLELHAGQLSTEAEVRAHPPEGHVLVGRAVDVEAIRIGELALVVVGGHEPDHHLVAALDLPVAERRRRRWRCAGSAS